MLDKPVLPASSTLVPLSPEAVRRRPATTEPRAVNLGLSVRSGAAPPPQAGAAPRSWWCSLRRLCVAAMRRHSLLQSRPVAALEAADRAVELDLPEHARDRRLALPVQGATLRGSEHAPHGVVEVAGPARAGASAQAGVGSDEHFDAVAGDRFDLALIPVAGVGEHNVRVAELDWCATRVARRGPSVRGVRSRASRW